MRHGRSFSARPRSPGTSASGPSCWKRRRTSRRVVKDDAQRVAPAGADSAHSVPQVHPIDSSASPHRTLTDGEHHSISLLERYYLGPRLHSGPLLSHHELPAVEVVAWPGEQNGHLQRKNVLAVDVLVQAVVIPSDVLQQERCGIPLPRRVTPGNELPVLFRKAQFRP